MVKETTKTDTQTDIWSRPAEWRRAWNGRLLQACLNDGHRSSAMMGFTADEYEAFQAQVVRSALRLRDWRAEMMRSAPALAAPATELHPIELRLDV